jgi:sugar lactone lactonase YvrE
VIKLAVLGAFMALVATSVLYTPAPSQAEGAFPEIIALPNGWLPEGVAVGDGPVIYAGSRRHGAIYEANLVTGTGRVLVPEQQGRVSVGLAYDTPGKRIWVAGGGGGAGYVYDAETGASLASYRFVTDGAPTFVNDVDMARDAAYFTDSRPLIYKVPLGPNGTLGTSFETIPLPAGWSLNGIVVSQDNKTLIGVQSNLGVLVRVDIATGAASLIDLGGYSVTQGDGLLLEGNTIWVMRNQRGVLAEIALNSSYTSGILQREITHPRFDVPTTIDRYGSKIYAVNARFSSGNDPNLTYAIVGVDTRTEE